MEMKRILCLIWVASGIALTSAVECRAQLPDGPGKTTVQKACGACHAAEMVPRQSHERRAVECRGRQHGRQRSRNQRCRLCSDSGLPGHESKQPAPNHGYRIATNVRRRISERVSFATAREVNEISGSDVAHVGALRPIPRLLSLGLRYYASQVQRLALAPQDGSGCSRGRIRIARVAAPGARLRPI